MNCKPGDLAIVTHSNLAPHAVGRITRCVVMKPCPLRQVPAWRVEPAVAETVWIDGILHHGDWVLDECLRPIRDPGDEAQDESKSWLPTVPSSHKETA